MESSCVSRRVHPEYIWREEPIGWGGKGIASPCKDSRRLWVLAIARHTP